MNKLYLFKRAADSQWIFGPNADCEHPKGVCRVIPNTDRTKVTIVYIHKNEANQNIFDKLVTEFMDKDGVVYADFAALKVGYAGFFS